MPATIVWFRQDLRLRDNPALAAALKRGAPVLPLYILDDEGEGRWAPGGASRWWLHHSLAALDASLRARGSRLLLAQGRSGDVLAEVIRQSRASAVYWNRRYEPAVIERDKTLKAALTTAGIEAKSFNASLLFEPHTVKNKSGGPFQVFTPYWKHCQTLPVEEPTPLPAGDFPAPAQWPASVELPRLQLLPTIKWDAGMVRRWEPGEEAGARCLKKFVALSAEDYADQRNFPNIEGTSTLSPYLHFGEVGPRQVWAAARALSKDSGIFPANRGVQTFLSEIGWREFAHHLLFHFPQTPTAPLREDFKKFPWAKDTALLKAWQRGRTGYPIVDAGMRQLWTTGWMHNRVRMIVASFLVKHLRLSWEEGAAWFWDTLVDADLASNTLGWQWSAGCGADAAPYFRIFNPILQGEKFDPEGHYVRQWVPELAKLPAEFVHKPWEAPAHVQERAGVDLGGNYPEPVVDHASARDAALAALKTIRREQPGEAE